MIVAEPKSVAQNATNNAIFFIFFLVFRDCRIIPPPPLKKSKARRVR